MVHISETCGTEEAHLLTHVHTTAARVQEGQCTAPIPQALSAKGWRPAAQGVEAAYTETERPGRGWQDYASGRVSPTRTKVSWQTAVDGAYRLEQFAIDSGRRQ